VPHFHEPAETLKSQDSGRLVLIREIQDKDKEIAALRGNYQRLKAEADSKSREISKLEEEVARQRGS
jgi:hypothetical protein